MPDQNTPQLFSLILFLNRLQLNSICNKKASIVEAFVIPLGLEPRTHTLKVYCSTN
jgi:hypothetical protein